MYVYIMYFLLCLYAFNSGPSIFCGKKSIFPQQAFDFSSATICMLSVLLHRLQQCTFQLSSVKLNMHTLK